MLIAIRFCLYSETTLFLLSSKAELSTFEASFKCLIVADILSDTEGFNVLSKGITSNLILFLITSATKLLLSVT